VTLQIEAPQTPDYPRQSLDHLDALWVQIGGTLCNLTCSHCFVSSSPTNLNHPMMSRDQVAARVVEALAFGVKEVYFTGGEPFLHPQLLDVLEDTLPHMPCTVLTNGTLFSSARLEALGRLTREARHSLEIRVSLDGDRAEIHDAFRGAGSFARVIDGLIRCEAHGLLPIVTVTRASVDDEATLHDRVLTMLRAVPLARPRIKLLPMFRLGREAQRSGPPGPGDSLAGLPQELIASARLQCAGCRAVTSRGIHVCPLLVDEPGGLIADRLDQALGAFELRHAACSTCFATGMTCANG